MSLTAIARDIKLSHSLFAMPFALLATFLAAGYADRLPGIDELVLIVLCMVFARTVAMTVNRWADRELDAQNPRTAGRAIPSGRVSGGAVLSTAGVCALLFVLCTAGFWLLRDNPWPLILSPLVLAWVAGYSFTKRFTWLCHLFLGSALAVRPVAAAIAIEPGYLEQIDVYLLAVMVMCWVAGFDVIYALQDVAADREQGLFSLPSRVGVEPALWVSRLLHVIVAAMLVALIVLSTQLDALVWGGRTHRLPMAFFTVNGVISVVLGVAGIVDVWLRL
jgi:4-hydroxybenzoate polyprenyltransferase